MAQALLIVDVQRDFLPGGALAVPGGDAVIEPINRLAADSRFAIVLATRDWHPPDHESFHAQGGPWPEHCVAGTPGAQLDERLSRDRIDAVLDTGVAADQDGYSAFENPELSELLRSEHIDAVTIVGLATDVCVVHTARAALGEGLTVTVRTDGTRGIDADGSREALSELQRAGARVE